MTEYRTYRIEYNEEQNINDYLDKWGHSILCALTAWDTTRAEAIEQMQDAYGKIPVNRWVRRHHITIR